MTIVHKTGTELLPGSSPVPRINRHRLPIGRRGYSSLSPITKPARLRTLPLPFESEAEQPPPSPTDSSGNQETIKGHEQYAVNGRAELPQPAAGQLQPAAGQLQPAAGQLQPTAGQSAAQHLVAQLAREVKSIEVAGRAGVSPSGPTARVFTTGCSSLDECLPAGGYEAGTVIEYLQSCQGSGATTLALAAARDALACTDRFCVVVDWRQQFYPPAAAALGIDLKRLVIVRPQTLTDRLWAIDQALRSPAIVAVIAELEHLDDRAARRLQLAAERGGGLGLLVRSLRQRHQPSWAEVQWQVRALIDSPSVPHRQLELQLLRARGGRTGMRAQVQINATSGRIEPGTAAAALARTLARQPRASEPPSSLSPLGPLGHADPVRGIA